MGHPLVEKYGRTLIQHFNYVLPDSSNRTKYIIAIVQMFNSSFHKAKLFT